MCPPTEDPSGDELIERHLPWLQSFVSRRMSRSHRLFEASADVTQDVLMRLVTAYGDLLPTEEGEFRALASTVVMNRIRDRHDWINAERRTRKKEAGEGVLETSHLAPAAMSGERPSRVASRKEDQRVLELALELLGPDDAHLVRLRMWEELEWTEIAERLNLKASTARMRNTRAMIELGRLMKILEERSFADLPGPSEAPLEE